MRLNDGRYECLYCGAVLDIPLTDKPRVTIHARSGEPNVRSLEFGGRVIHTCAIEPLTSAQKARRQSAELRDRAQGLRDRATELQGDADRRRVTTPQSSRRT